MRERASAVCVNDGMVLLVRLRDPFSRRQFLVPPGGLIEKDEEPAATAVRETFEETGCRIELLPQISSVHDYFFDWNGRNIPCRTHYFGARLIVEEAPSRDAEYNLGKVWEPLENILANVERQGKINQIVHELAVRVHAG